MRISKHALANELAAERDIAIRGGAVREWLSRKCGR
jgi:hypothetical protein